MPQLPSGRHIALTAARLAELARQYEETGEPAAIGQVRSRADIEPYIDVLYFRSASPGRPADSSLPAGLEPYPSGFTLATIGEEARSWPKEDREAFEAFLRRGEAVGLLTAAFAQALNAQARHKLASGEELTEADAMTAGIALMMADRSGQFIDDDEFEPARPPRPRGSETPLDTPPAPVLPASFYQLLVRLLALPEIGSVSFRGDPDFEFLRLACAERLRRHPDVETLPTDEGFAVNVLDTESRWPRAIEDDEFREEGAPPTLPGWLYWVQWWDEGLGFPREVLVETRPLPGMSLSEMDREFLHWKAIVSFAEPDLALEGYRWYRVDGFCLGVREDEERILKIAEAWATEAVARQDDA